jgi:redox-sensitive bicupin YhaK (pirin superfamily)
VLLYPAVKNKTDEVNMMTIRKADERGTSDFGWLDSRHTFSFGEYYDPQHMGYRTLRVINDDKIAAGGGFGTHPHRDMEIVTVVFAGALEHKDSMGSVEVLHPGEVQRMTAGTGLTHSEYNHSSTDPVHLIQIWILPERKGLRPSYEQKRFDSTNQLRLVVSPDSRDGSLKIHQDASLYVATLTDGVTVTHNLAPGRQAWLQVATGAVDLNGVKLNTGDGVAISEEKALTLKARGAASVLLFDLA